MAVNYTLVFLATLAQFIVGALWYSPLLFGKWWMQIMEKENVPIDEMKKMQKEMGPFYMVQFFLTLFTTFSLANLYSRVIDPTYGLYHIAFWLWIGFIVPVQISAVVWGNTKKKHWAKQIFVMVSMQLVGIMLASWILLM